MADPIEVECPAGELTKVATNVTAGFVHILSGTNQIWYQMYKDTGGAAPTDLSLAVPYRRDGITEKIDAASGIDVYIYPTEKAGSARVDL